MVVSKYEGVNHMKKAVTIILITLLIVAPAYAVYDGHIYYAGRVTNISENLLTVDENIYEIADNCRVAILYKKISGAFYEEPARLSDVNVGDWVTVKIEGKIIREILIESYK